MFRSFLHNTVRPAVRAGLRNGKNYVNETVQCSSKRRSRAVGVAMGAVASLAAIVDSQAHSAAMKTKPRYSMEFDPSVDMPDDADPRDAYWLPLGKNWKDGRVNAYIENPTSSQNKYEYDHETHMLTLDRVLHTAISYPTDYGFIPRTLSEDGDALDVCVISFFPLVAGSMVQVRVVGVLLMEDEKGIDEKLLAVVDSDPRANHYQSLDHLAPHVKKEIAHFFQRYKDLEPGKWAKVGAWLDKKEACDIIQQCHKRFSRYYDANPEKAKLLEDEKEKAKKGSKKKPAAKPAAKTDKK